MLILCRHHLTDSMKDGINLVILFGWIRNLMALINLVIATREPVHTHHIAGISNCLKDGQLQFFFIHETGNTHEFSRTHGESCEND